MGEKKLKEMTPSPIVRDFELNGIWFASIASPNIFIQVTSFKDTDPDLIIRATQWYCANNGISAKLPEKTKSIMHELEYGNRWMPGLRTLIKKGGIDSFQFSVNLKTGFVDPVHTKISGVRPAGYKEQVYAIITGQQKPISH